MNFTYAQLDENSIAFAVSTLSMEINGDNMIRLTDFDTSVIGKKYNNGVWEDCIVDSTPEVKPQPTNAELKELQLTQMDAIATMYEQAEIDKINQYEVLATILENTTGVE